MPRGRAVLGGLLIAAAAVIVFAGAVASTRSGSAGYVVASRSLGVGAVIGPGDTATETFSLPPGTRAEAFRNGATLIGRALAVPVESGELIQSSMLAPPAGGPPLRPVSITVDTASLAGLSPGDPVDVLSAPSASSAGGSASAGGGPAAAGADGGGVTVVLRGADLLSVSRPGSTLAPASSATTVVTVGVSDLDEARMLVSAEHAGTVELVRAEPPDGTGPGPVSAG